MNVIYDSKTDTLSIELAPGAVAQSDEEKPGVILITTPKATCLVLRSSMPRGAFPDLTSVNLRVAL